MLIDIPEVMYHTPPLLSRHFIKQYYYYYSLTDLWRSKALTVPSREQLTTTLPKALKQTPVTPEVWSENVTKQKPEVVFHSFTCE